MDQGNGVTVQTDVAFVRQVSDSFSDAVTTIRLPGGSRPEIDPIRARAQHGQYVDALGMLGLAVVAIEPDEAFPDGCFVEDSVVVADGLALLTRSAHLARRGEGARLRPFYESAGLIICEMAPPATLDGGDVLRVGDTLFVGMTARTNAAGVALLRDVFEPRGLHVCPVAMPPGILHLKCVVSSPAPETVVLADETLPANIFSGLRVLSIPAAERYAANTVGRMGTVILADGYPKTRAVLERAGLDTVALDTSEFKKADGSLTCLSVIL